MLRVHFCKLDKSISVSAEMRSNIRLGPIRHIMSSPIRLRKTVLVRVLWGWTSIRLIKFFFFADSGSPGGPN